MDAYMSLALAGKKWGLAFPSVTESNEPFIEAKGMFHILLSVPVPYDISMHKEGNFIFLTGANMAGKSTFIKAVGISVYLAHLGMGVPAREMKVSLLDGIVSNIQITDNLIKGESFFYNEVQRIKNTIEKINTGFKLNDGSEIIYLNPETAITTENFYFQQKKVNIYMRGIPDLVTLSQNKLQNGIIKKSIGR
jgi:dsDNA-specific endonuclease/ATPase MutS2